MDIRNALLKEQSKKQVDLIVNYISSNPKLFDELMQCFYSDNQKLKLRASWCLSYCIENYPPLLNPYLEKLLPILCQPVHQGIKRNIVRALMFVSLPEQYEAIVANTCFELLKAGDESIAVRANAMTVLANICRKHPDMKYELQQAIQLQLPYASTGFKARAKNILKQLNSIK